MSRHARVTQLEAEIARLGRARDAQPPDTLYALSYQNEIDTLAAELIAWRLQPAKMAAAHGAMREANRRLHRAHTGRRRWPMAAAITGLFGAAATAGHLVADAAGLPLVGSGLLTTSAAALAAAVAERVRDGHNAAQAETDITEARRRYTDLVQHHTRALTPLPALPADQEATTCSQQPDTAAPSTSTPATATATANSPADGGHPSAVSPPSAAPSWTAAVSTAP